MVFNGLSLTNRPLLAPTLAFGRIPLHSKRRDWHGQVRENKGYDNKGFEKGEGKGSNP